VNSKEESNWRLIKNSERGKYCFLIGVNKWAVELQEHEFDSLYKVLDKLINEFNSLQKQLMDEELISLEMESLPWYGELEGSKDNWSLRMIFESNEETRSFEMYWPSPIAKKLFFKMRKMWESMQ